jgi:hypothetical protein
MAEWSIATDCKSVALTGYLGSNPGPSTMVEKTTSNDLYPVPKNLDEARRAVCSLPGVDRYLTPDTEVDLCLDAMIQDVIRDLDAKNMMSVIAVRSGWSEKKAQNFFTDSERQPYASQIEFSSQTNEREQQFITIGRYLKHRYEESKDKIARQNLATFLDYSNTNLFYSSQQRLTDQINGFNPGDRQSGNIHSTEEILSLMRSESERIALSEGVRPDDLYNRVLAATEGGDFSTIALFLRFNKGESALRHALEGIYTKRMRDYDFTVQKLQLVWDAEKYRQSIGIDLNTQYTLVGYPDTQTIEQRIREYLTDEKLAQETFRLLNREAQSVFKRWQLKNGFIDYDEIVDAIAHFHNFPDMVSTPAELAEKWQRVLHESKKILPRLAFLDTPRAFVMAPTNMGAEKARAWSMSYQNIHDETVYVGLVNPRVSEEKLLEQAVHELGGHKLFLYMVVVAENAGYVPKGSFNNVYQYGELFSRLMERANDNIMRIRKSSQQAILTDTKPQENGTYNDLMDALDRRSQGPLALTQLKVREIMEELWNHGKRDDLTPDEAAEIINLVQPQLEEWSQLGVPIMRLGRGILNNVDPVRIFDGLEYLRDQMKQKDESQDMETAFETKFNDLPWLLNPDAVTIYLALLAETAKNPNVANDGSFVMNADIATMYTRLSKWHITKNLISPAM